MNVIKVPEEVRGLFGAIEAELAKIPGDGGGDGEKEALLRLMAGLRPYGEAYCANPHGKAADELDKFLADALRAVYAESFPAGLTPNKEPGLLLAPALLGFLRSKVEELSRRLAVGLVRPDEDPPVPEEPAPRAEAAPAPTASDEVPVLHIQLKPLDPGGNDLRRQEHLKHLIDSAEPIMGETGRRFFYSFDLNIDKYFLVTSVQGSPFLTETLGLTASLDDDGLISLRGTPLEGFDGQLVLAVAWDGEGPGLRHQKPMYIAADPRTLWRDLPVEDYQGYPHPDEAWEGRFWPAVGKAALAASCRGRSHAHAAKPRDDSFALEADEETGWHFAAVADGAGSAQYSRRGSALACRTALAGLREYLAAPGYAEEFAAYAENFREWKALFEAEGGADAGGRQLELRAGLKVDKIVHRVVYDCYQAISEEAARRGAAVRDYHTTLLFAAFKKFDFGYFFVSYWVGDGAMGLYNWNGTDRTVVFGSPDGGEFAGQTRFLTMMKEEINAEAIFARTRYAFADDFEALVLMTDGLTDPFFPSEKDVADDGAWRSFWNEALKRGKDGNPGCPPLFDSTADPDFRARALRQWLNFWSKGNHDDRTILIIK